MIHVSDDSFTGAMTIWISISFTKTRIHKHQNIRLHDTPRFPGQVLFHLSAGMHITLLPPSAHYDSLTGTESPIFLSCFPLPLGSYFIPHMLYQNIYLFDEGWRVAGVVVKVSIMSSTNALVSSPSTSTLPQGDLGAATEDSSSSDLRRRRQFLCLTCTVHRWIMTGDRHSTGKPNRTEQHSRKKAVAVAKKG